LVALGALGPAELWAEAAQREYVVLLLPEQETPTALRLKAEISKLDLGVKVAQTDDPVDPDEPRMAELAQLFGGEALVLLSPNGRVATIWFSHAQPGDRLKRVVQAESGSADLRSESVIVGTMELLRVRLLTRRPPEPPPPEPAPPPPPPPPPAPPPPIDDAYRPLALGVLVGLDKPSPSLSFGSSYQVNLDLTLAKPFALSALLRLPAASSSVKRDRATAEVKSVVTAAGFSVGFDPVAPLTLELFGGVGAARVSARGFSEIDAILATKSEWVFVSVGAARGSVRLTPALSLTLQAGLAFASVPVEIWLNGSRASVWGRPSPFAGLGLELRPNLR